MNPKTKAASAKGGPQKTSKSAPIITGNAALADAYLVKRGSTLAAAKREGARVADVQAMKLLGYKRQFAVPALRFPTLDPLTGEVTGPGRARFLEAVKDDNGDDAKFRGLPGEPLMPYIAFHALGGMSGWPKAAKNTSIDIHVTEGETRALPLAAEGIYCIALGGVRCRVR